VPKVGNTSDVMGLALASDTCPTGSRNNSNLKLKLGIAEFIYKMSKVKRKLCILLYDGKICDLSVVELAPPTLHRTVFTIELSLQLWLDIQAFSLMRRRYWR